MKVDPATSPQIVEGISMSNALTYACIVVGTFFGFGSYFFLHSSQSKRIQKVLGIVFGGFAPLLLSYGFYLIAMPKEMLQGELEAARIDTQKPILELIRK
jgi:hypothetical protein